MAIIANARVEKDGGPTAFLLSRKSQLQAGQLAIYGKVVQVDYIDRTVHIVTTNALQDNGKATAFSVPYPLRLNLDLKPPKANRVVIPRVGNEYGFVLSKTTLNETLAGTSSIASALWDPHEDDVELPATGWSYPNTVISDPIVLPIVFPVLGGAQWSDTFLADRDGGKRQHLGQDLMAPKFTPLVAAIEGIVTLKKGKTPTDGNSITITRDDGWRVVYLHVNCDNPGTTDGKGSDLYAFAPNLKTGDFVKAGQFVGWVGDSGNARGGPSHCHFEIRRNGVINAAPSLTISKKMETAMPEIANTELPQPGEVRVDAVVLSIDPQTATARCMMSAEIDDSGNIRIATLPQFFDTRLRGVALQHRVNHGVRVGPELVNPGTRISLIGKRVASGELVPDRAYVVPSDEPISYPVAPLSPEGSRLTVRPSTIPSTDPIATPPVQTPPVQTPPAQTPPVQTQVQQESRPKPPIDAKPPTEVKPAQSTTSRPRQTDTDVWIERARQNDGLNSLSRSEEIDRWCSELTARLDSTEIVVQNVAKLLNEKGFAVDEAILISAPHLGDAQRAAQTLVSGFRTRSVILLPKWSKFGNSVSDKRFSWLFVRK
jgi:murein DD-endopeptidase MepM/ murein hydrolase activator NlpD